MVLWKMFSNASRFGLLHHKTNQIAIYINGCRFRHLTLYQKINKQGQERGQTVKTKRKKKGKI